MALHVEEERTAHVAQFHPAAVYQLIAARRLDSFVLKLRSTFRLKAARSARLNSGVRFLWVRKAVMGRIEWLKWRMSFGSRKGRAQQLWLFLAFEVYYQLCKLRGYKVNHFLQWQGKPVPEGAQPKQGKYILVWPSLPFSIRVLDRIFPVGRDAHAEYLPYTPEVAEEIKKTGRRAEVVEIWSEFRFVGSHE